MPRQMTSSACRISVVPPGCDPDPNAHRIRSSIRSRADMAERTSGVPIDSPVRWRGLRDVTYHLGSAGLRAKD